MSPTHFRACAQMAAAAAAAPAPKALPYMGFLFIQKTTIVVARCPLGCQESLNGCVHQRVMTHGQRVAIPLECSVGHRLQYEGVILVESPERLLDPSIDDVLRDTLMKTQPLCGSGCVGKVGRQGTLIYGLSAVTSLERLIGIGEQAKNSLV